MNDKTNSTSSRMSPNDFMNLEQRYGAHNYHPLPVVLTRGEGVWVWDTSGRKYLDCLSAYSALNFGHRHPKLVNAMQSQLGLLPLTSRAFYNDKLGPFLERLCKFTGMEVALPMNTGAEAVETGIKIARRWGYQVKGIPSDRAEIIVCERNFHGRTTTIVGFSSDEDSWKGFGPATPGFPKIPFNDPAALEAAISPNTAAFLVEPIQGEAGVIIPSAGYLKKIAGICHKHGVLLILDEIQTGFGRTGKNFAFMHEEIVPDILLVGKALGGGLYPVSAVLTRHEIMQVITPGSHGSTFGGNPLACSVGLAVLDLMEQDGITEHAAAIGDYFLAQLRGLSTPFINEVRGKGLMLAIDLAPKFGTARQFAEQLLNVGILAKDTHGQTLRIAPPLIIEKEIVDWAINGIQKSLTKR